MAGDGTRIEVDSKSLRLLVTALKKEADGKGLVKDLKRGLKAAAEPAAAAAKASIMSMPSHHADEPGLRQAIARGIKVSIRTGGRRAGVSIRASKLGMPRGFRNAPKRLNAAGGWRHKVFGHDRWVTQIGKPDWFDGTIARFKPAFKEAAKAAMEEIAKRISRDTRG